MAFGRFGVWSRIPVGVNRRKGFVSQQDFVWGDCRQFVIRGIIDNVPRGIARCGFRPHLATEFFEGQANARAVNISGEL